MKTKGSLIVAALFSAVFWGGSFPIVKYGLRYIKPLWFADFRMLVAFLAMYPFIKNKRQFWKLPRGIWWLGLFNAGGYALQFLGMETTTAAKASFFVSINVIFVVIFAHFFLREKLTWEKYGAIVLSFIGIYLLTMGTYGFHMREGSPLGDGLVLLAGVSWAVFIILGKKMLEQSAASVFEIVTTFVLATVVFLTPLAVLFEPFPTHFSGQELEIVLLTAIVFTSVPFYFWSVSLKGLTATLTSFLTLTEILFAVLFSAIFLGERLQGTEIIGGILLVLAIVVVSLRQ
ncbi:MAG: DMT family transporter [Calditrichaeota bacterium]|nr:DMT family transporter [Calditrichota bacterium]